MLRPENLKTKTRYSVEYATQNKIVTQASFKKYFAKHVLSSTLPAVALVWDIDDFETSLIYLMVAVNDHLITQIFKQTCK